MTDSRALLQSVRVGSPDDVEEDPITGAAIYARTSSASQEYGYSLDEQVRQCVDRCEMLDWPVEYVFRNQAISGKDTDRPMHQQMQTRA